MSNFSSIYLDDDNDNNGGSGDDDDNGDGEINNIAIVNSCLVLATVPNTSCSYSHLAFRQP